MAKDYEQVKAVADRNQQAREAEQGDDTEKAIELYEENIKTGIADPFAFERLMILYRKLKQYKDELRVINKGIKVFSDDLSRQQKSLITGAKNKKQVAELSKAIMKKSGLVDKKGNDTYVPEPLNKWMKRKAVVEKKLK